MTIMVTIMTRKTRNGRQRRGERRGGSRSTPPPTIRSLFAWTIFFVVIAVLVDWLVYREMAIHRQKYGHWYLPIQECICAIMVTGIAVTVPVVGYLQWRRGRQ